MMDEQSRMYLERKMTRNRIISTIEAKAELRKYEDQLPQAESDLAVALNNLTEAESAAFNAEHHVHSLTRKIEELRTKLAAVTPSTTQA